MVRAANYADQPQLADVRIVVVCVECQGYDPEPESMA
jgi:hypothetical protein